MATAHDACALVGTAEVRAAFGFEVTKTESRRDAAASVCFFRGKGFPTVSVRLDSDAASHETAMRRERAVRDGWDAAYHPVFPEDIADLGDLALYVFDYPGQTMAVGQGTLRVVKAQTFLEVAVWGPNLASDEQRLRTVALAKTILPKL